MNRKEFITGLSFAGLHSALGDNDERSLSHNVRLHLRMQRKSPILAWAQIDCR